MVEMEYLDPSEGWTPLLAYQGDVSALEPVIQKAISAFHQCLDGKAVHGDLRPPNIFVREGRCVGRLLKDSISLSQRATSDSHLQSLAHSPLPLLDYPEPPVAAQLGCCSSASHHLVPPLAGRCIPSPASALPPAE